MPDKLKGVLVVAIAIGLSVAIWFLIIGCVALVRKLRQKSWPPSVGVGVKIAAIFPAYIPFLVGFPLALEYLGLTPSFQTFLTATATAIPSYLSYIVLVTIGGLISTAVWFLLIGSLLLIKKLFKNNGPSKVGLKSKLFAIFPAAFPLLLVLRQALELLGYPAIAGPVIDRFFAFIPNIVAGIILTSIAGLIATAVWWITFGLISLFQKLISVEGEQLALMIRKGLTGVLALIPLWAIIPQALVTIGIINSSSSFFWIVATLVSICGFTAMILRQSAAAKRTNRVDSMNQ